MAAETAVVVAATVHTACKQRHKVSAVSLQRLVAPTRDFPLLRKLSSQRKHADLAVVTPLTCSWPCAAVATVVGPATLVLHLKQSAYLHCALCHIYAGYNAAQTYTDGRCMQEQLQGE